MHAQTAAPARWEDLTARCVALARADPQRWQACADRSDALEAQGVDPMTAVATALVEHGG